MARERRTLQLLVALASLTTTSAAAQMKVGAWNGGYEGRSAKVEVTVRDAGAISGDRAGDGDGEAADIFLLGDVTPEVATAALFGDLELDQEKLDALDRLGNRNGGYDLGDLLSWIERCRRGAGICGGPLSSSSQSIPAAAAALAGFGAARRNGGRRQDSGGRNPARRKARRRLDGGIRRRARTAWFGLALLFAAATTSGCADSVVEPPQEPEPGNLTVWLTGPAGVRDSGAMLVLSGPGIESVWAPDLELFESGASASRQIIISGAVASGLVLEFQVPDRMLSRQYRVQLLEVAGEDYFLRDLSDYSVDIRR